MSKPSKPKTQKTKPWWQNWYKPGWWKTKPALPGCPPSTTKPGGVR